MFASRRPCPAEQMHRCTGETRTANREPRGIRTGLGRPELGSSRHRTPNPSTEHRTSRKGLPALSTSSTHRLPKFHNGRSNTGKGTHSDTKTQGAKTRDVAPAGLTRLIPVRASAQLSRLRPTQARTAHSAQRHSHRATPRARRLHAHASHFLCPERPSAPSALAPLPLVPCASPVPCGARNGSQIRVCARRSAAPGERGTGNGEWGTGP